MRRRQAGWVFRAPPGEDFERTSLHLHVDLVGMVLLVLHIHTTLQPYASYKSKIGEEFAHGMHSV